MGLLRRLRSFPRDTWRVWGLHQTTTPNDWLMENCVSCYWLPAWRTMDIRGRTSHMLVGLQPQKIRSTNSRHEIVKFLSSGRGVPNGVSTGRYSFPTPGGSLSTQRPLFLLNLVFDRRYRPTDLGKATPLLAWEGSMMAHSQEAPITGRQHYQNTWHWRMPEDAHYITTVIL